MKTAIKGDKATIWSQMLVFALVYYVVGNIITLMNLVGKQVELALTGLAFGIGIMVALSIFYDRKQMEEDIDWGPSYLYFAGAFPGLLGVVALSWYLAKRDIMYNTDRMSEEAEGPEEDEEWDISVDELENEEQ